MKMKIGKCLFLCLYLFIGLIACKKDQTPDPAQNDVLKKYLEFTTKMSAINGNTGQMSDFLNVIGASQLQRKSLHLKSMNGDSVYTDTIPADSSGYWNNWTCADVTELDNADGTHTTVFDYGDGCDEYGAMVKGKITYIWKNEGNDYYSKVLYENYYGYGMAMNGFSEYGFTSDGNSYVEYDSTATTGEPDGSAGVAFYWSGTATGRDTMVITFDSGERYTYTSSYSNKWDNSTFTVLEGEYACTTEPEGYTYHYLVTSPLVYNYECPDTWISVSGIETIHYLDSEASYDFLIDYGDGTCDNLATITENGESSVIDFGELIRVYCGDDASVGASSGGK
jgi:hypothetical protein